MTTAHPEADDRPDLTSLAEFFEERADWLEVYTAPGRHGGTDVVLRLDGTYYLTDEDHAAMADYLADWLRETGASVQRDCRRDERAPRRTESE